MTAPTAPGGAPALPPGEYTIEAWHEKLGARAAKVTVAPSGTAQADFTYESRLLNIGGKEK